MHYIIVEDLKTIVESIKDESKKLEGKTLLISGGSGFLGSYIVGTIGLLNQKILQKPCRVLSLDNFITSSRESFIGPDNDKDIVHIETDITKPITIKEPVDFVIHAAGLASPVYYQKFPLQTIEAAITGAKNLLELARQNPSFKSFLFLSSSEIYGDPHKDFIPTPEHYRGNVSSIGPRACYDESKRLAETICMTYQQIYNIPLKIVRPFNVYGPGMKTDDYRVVPNFIAKGLRGAPLFVYDKGSQTRTFCYITDAVTGFLKVLLSEQNGQVYNVGTDRREISIVDLAKLVSNLFDHPVPVQLVTYPKIYPAGEPLRRCPDITKIKTNLNYHPNVDLKTGLLRTIKWFQETLS